MSEVSTGKAQVTSKKRKNKKKPGSTLENPTVGLADQELTKSHLITALQNNRTQLKRLELVCSRLAENIDKQDHQLKENDDKIRNIKYMSRYYQSLLRENGIDFPVECNKTLMPGVSEKIANDLRTNLVNLQQELNYTKADYYQVQKEKELIHTLYRQLDLKDKALRQAEESVKHFETAFQSSDNVKDQEIHRLIEEVSKHTKKENLQELMCQSLYSECESYKTRIQDTENELKEFKLKFVSDDRTKADDISTSTSSTSQSFEQLEREKEALKKELLTVRGKFREVVGLNKKWQAYNNDQQNSMRNLKTRIQELEKVIKSTTEKESPQGKETLDKLMEVNTKEVERIQSEKSAVENTLKRVQKDFSDLKERFKEEQELRVNFETEVEKLKSSNSTDETYKAAMQTELNTARAKFKEAQEQVKKWQAYHNSNESKIKDMTKHITDLEKMLAEANKTQRKSPERTEPKPLSDVERAANQAEMLSLRNKFKESSAQNVKWQVYNNDIQKKMKTFESRVKELETIIQSTQTSGDDAMAANQLLDLNMKEMERMREENQIFSERMNQYNEVVERLRQMENAQREQEKEQQQLYEMFGTELTQEKRRSSDLQRQLDQMKNEIKHLQAENRGLTKQKQEMQIKLSKIGPAQAEASIHPELKAHYESQIEALRNELDAARQRSTDTSLRTYSSSGSDYDFQKNWSQYQQQLSKYRNQPSAFSFQQQYQPPPVLARSSSQTPTSPENQGKGSPVLSHSPKPFHSSTATATVVPMSTCSYCGKYFKTSELDDHKKTCNRK